MRLGNAGCGRIVCVLVKKVHILVQRKQRCIEKVLLLQLEWQNLNKRSSRQTEAHINTESC